MTVINQGGAPLRRVITEIGNVNLQDKKTWLTFDGELRSQNRTLAQLPVNVGPRQPDHNAEMYLAGDMTVQRFNAFRGLLSSLQTTRMLDFACKLPAINKRHIEVAGFDMFGISTTVGQSRIADFGLAVEKDLLRIPARLLAPPRLHYRGSNPLNPNEASWNLVNRKFFTGATALESVAMLDLDPQLHGSVLTEVPKHMTVELRRLGMANVLVRRIDLNILCDSIPSESALLELFKLIPKDTSAVFVILPEHSYDLYSRIKRVAEIGLGQHVVCAVARKIDGFEDDFRANMHYANIGMKFNLKGRGINHNVDGDHLRSIIQPGSTAACQTIIIGADVAHATGSARPGCPSIAGVVGSVDDNYLHYPGSMRLQLNRQEFIADLRDMVKERLIDWAVKHRDMLPANMLMYRDGVSESQYQAVREFEIPQL